MAEAGKEQDLDFAQMCKRDLTEDMTDTKCKNIKQAWQQ
jgi:hypothetical protein